MQLGWIAHSDLQRWRLAPLGSTDKYHGVMQMLRSATGNTVHWMQLKHLDDHPELPSDASERDERELLTSVVHYGDALRPIVRWTQSFPSSGRYELIDAAYRRGEAPWDQVRYAMPYLDAVIVEGTHQINAAYALTFVLRRLWEINPNIGFIFIDQDLAGQPAFGKANKWHPDLHPRSVILTYYPHQRYVRCGYNQGVTVIPHQPHREHLPHTPWDEPELCYVGNDYLRRDAMLRFLRGPRVHHYGKIKDDFRDELVPQGATLHGPFRPYDGCSIEDLYRGHGCAVAFLRDDYYKWDLLTPRLSEASRAGVPVFIERKCRLSMPLLGDYFHVQTLEEILAKVDVLWREPDLWRDWIAWQQAQFRRYWSPERAAESMLHAARALCAGPLRGYHHNAYDDLTVAAGLPAWEG